MKGDTEPNGRNWQEYNETLVKRGEMYLTFNFLKSWEMDLEKLNRDKLGRRYSYPWSFIELLMMIHVIFHLPYRQLEGFLRKLSELIPGIKPTDYTNIWRRGTKLKLNISDTISTSDESVVIAVDSTGIKVTNRGEWMREKWRVHRGWIKVHLAVNVKTKEIVGIEVTDERVSDGSRFNSLIDQSKENLSGRKIEVVLGDGAFDRKEIFDHLQQAGIQPVIKTRSNANTKARGSSARAKAVREIKNLGYSLWKQKYNYGRRCAVESVFSAVKRISGEYVAATKTENMMQEAILKFSFYNMLIH
jgi:Transposase DDE domain